MRSERAAINEMGPQGRAVRGVALRLFPTGWMSSVLTSRMSSTPSGLAV